MLRRFLALAGRWPRVRLSAHIDDRWSGGTEDIASEAQYQLCPAALDLRRVVEEEFGYRVALGEVAVVGNDAQAVTCIQRRLGALAGGTEALVRRLRVVYGAGRVLRPRNLYVQRGVTPGSVSAARASARSAEAVSEASWSSTRVAASSSSTRP